MREAKWIPETKRNFYREKRRQLRMLRHVINDLSLGCAMLSKYDFSSQIRVIEKMICEIDVILKPFK